MVYLPSQCNGIAQSIPESPPLGSPASALGSSSSLYPTIGCGFLWWYTCGLNPEPGCVYLKCKKTGRCSGADVQKWKGHPRHPITLPLTIMILTLPKEWSKEAIFNPWFTKAASGIDSPSASSLDCPLSRSQVNSVKLSKNSQDNQK